MNNLKYYERFKTEIMYLWNDEAEVYVKSDPAKGYFAKHKGGDEFSIAADSNTVVMAIDAQKEVSKKEYDDA
jgi:hypothetical protein